MDYCHNFLGFCIIQLYTEIVVTVKLIFSLGLLNVRFNHTQLYV